MVFAPIQTKLDQQHNQLSFPARDSEFSPRKEALSSRAVSSDNEPKIVEHKGDKTVGSIDLIYQVHRSRSGGDTTATRVHVGKYQATILGKLIELKPEVIFDEKNSIDILPDDPDRDAILNAAQIKDAFPDGLPKDLSKLNRKQLLTLEKYGAGDVYAVLVDKNVKLLKTSDKETDAIVKKLQSDDDPSNDNQAIYDIREERLKRSVDDYLVKNQGTKIIIIYGANHKQIPERLQDRDRKPNVTTYEWQELLDSSSFALGKKITSETDVKKQNQALEKASSISEIVFGKIITSEGQLIALRKLDVSTEDFKSAEAFRDTLLLEAKDPKVKAEILKLYNEYKAGSINESNPFSQFSALEISDRILDAFTLEKKRALLASAKEIYAYAITEDWPKEMQLEALRKVIPGIGIASHKQLYNSLKEVITDPTAKAQLEKYYREETGPFASNKRR